MFAALVAALILAVLVSAIVYVWVRLSPKLVIEFSGLRWRRLETLGAFWRLPDIVIDLKAPYRPNPDCHYSLNDPEFSREWLGSLLWGVRAAAKVEGLHWRFSPARMKFLIHIKRISFFYNIRPDIFHTDGQKKSSTLHNNVFRLLQIFLCIEVDELNLVLTTMPDCLSNYDSIYFIELKISNLAVFKDLDHFSLDARPHFQISGADIFLGEYGKETFELLEDKRHNIVTVKTITANMALTESSLRLDVIATPLGVNLNTTSLMFIATIARMAKSSKKEAHCTSSPLDRTLLSLQFKSINVNVKLPALENSLQPISKLSLFLENTSIDLVADSGKCNFISSASCVKLSSCFKKTPDQNCFTKVDKIFQRLPTGEHADVLISLIDLTIGNSNRLFDDIPKAALSEDHIKDFFASLLKGQVRWDALVLQKSNSECLQTSLQSIIGTGRAIDALLYSEPRPKAFAISCSSISFNVPFEYPLSTLIEDASVMFKAPIMMFEPFVTPQKFNIFKDSWQICLACPKLNWTFGDDPFEAKLWKIHQSKQDLSMRFYRLERMFWKRLEKESKGMTKPSSDTIPASSLAFARSASFGDLITENPAFLGKFTKFNSELFKLYRGHLKQLSQDAYPGLMDVQIANVCLNLKWDPEYLGVHHIHDLLNAMENSSAGYTAPMIDKFSVALGAFMEFSGQQLSVFLRDSEAEFVSADTFLISGPVFLLEEGAYPQACLRVPVKTGVSTAVSNVGPNIIEVIETVLPVKFFHSLSACLDGSYGFRAAFCPYWDGMFVGLDRAFDMLSKHTRESSPRLAIWDKFRLLVHSTFGYMRSNAPCSFSFVPGKVGALNEALIIKLDGGFVFEQRPDGSYFEFDEFEGLVESKHMSVLWHLLNSRLKSLNASALSPNGTPLIKLIHFAKTKFKLTLDCKNKNGVAPIEHQQIVTEAALEGTVESAEDSYRDFRLGAMTVNLEIITADMKKADVTSLYLYDELIGWVQDNLFGYTETSIRRGPLFTSPFVAINTSGKDSVVSIIDEIHFKFHFDGAFSCTYLNFFDDQNYTGLHLSSTETNIVLDYAKAQPMGETAGIDAKWIYYYGEVDLRNVNLDVVSSDMRLSVWKGRFRLPDQLGILPTDIISMSHISAPRLFYSCSDDLCFSHDIKARDAQLRSSKRHEEDFQNRLKALENALKSGHSDNVVKEIAVLKEQRSLMTSVASAQNVEKHFYFIHDAKLYWHQALRNEVYRFIDQQFVRHMVRKSKSRLVLENIRKMGLEQARVASPTASSPRPGSPFSKNSAVGNSSEDVKQFYEKLLKRSSAIYATEEVDEDKEFGEAIDMQSALEVVSAPDSSFALDKITNIYFYGIQVILVDESGRSIAITAPYTTVEIGSIIDIIQYDVSRDLARIGSRSKIVFEDFCMYVSEEINWTVSAVYDKITEPASAAVLFNSKDIHYAGHLDISSLGLGRGSTITVYAPGLNLFMNSDQYALTSSIISNLLVYRDPGQQLRAEQLESLVLASDVLDKSAIVETVENLQNRVHRLETSLAESTFRSRISQEKFKEKMEKLRMLSEELGLIVETMTTIEVTREKWSKRQVRLQLDIVLDTIDLTMLRIDRSPMIALSLQAIKDTWISDEDFSMSNLIEIGVVLAQSKTPGSFYKTLLEPLPKSFYQASGIGLGLSDQILRFYWKTLVPIGGIPIIEHVEVNLAPLSIQLSYEIAAEATKFFLPDKPKTQSIHVEEFDMVDESDLSEVRRSASGLSREPSFGPGGKGSLSRMESMDEIMSMKQKASDHCSFVSIRVPATQQYISYKVKSA